MMAIEKLMWDGNKNTGYITKGLAKMLTYIDSNTDLHKFIVDTDVCCSETNDLSVVINIRIPFGKLESVQ